MYAYVNHYFHCAEDIFSPAVTCDVDVDNCVSVVMANVATDVTVDVSAVDGAKVAADDIVPVKPAAVVSGEPADGVAVVVVVVVVVQ
ncbi:hypothetical protein DPMN_120790 [Dreissena polymorpha]|uniref:Uncharacterized protein n=1 Tax=Dreissena polymorpha TaxID=45954 RepID=A0A9D4GPL3_DREPO|nr:hypothetical protein DPMN_120790 [Dreissena polymorpha]